MSPTKLKERRARAAKISRTLKRLFPDADETVLKHKNPWELVVAVQLSAQTTDKQVNVVTPALFRKYRRLDDYVRAPQREFEKVIRSIGFYHAKARNILAAANLVKTKFNGKVPQTMAELIELPGVARKTANVVLWNAFKKVEGIAVDTHVRRFAIKFDLSDFADPVRIERDLMELLPKKEWPYVTYQLIEYGRTICPARKHDCATHPLSKIYPPAATRWPSR